MTASELQGLPPEIVAWVEAELGATVVHQSRIGSGASREIWAVDVPAGAGDGELRSVVVRFDPGTGPVSGTALDLDREATVYAALRDTEIPIPRFLAVEPHGRAILMERAHGEENLAAVDDIARRQSIARDYLEWLGRLHRLDVDRLAVDALGRPSSGPAHALDDLELWSSIMRDRGAGWTAPATEFAVEWLRDYAPTSPSATSVCHGDAGPGNFLFDGSRVTALLDWEFAHIGDPHDDLAWVAVRNPLLGSPIDIADAFLAWRDVTGLPLETQRLEYYRVFVLTRMLISCDAAVAWKNGVVDESILTHSILRPWLATAILTGIRLAGGGSPEVDHLASLAAKAAEDSEYASFVAMIPPLAPFETITEF